MTKTTASAELVTVLSRDGEKFAVEFQNGTIERYILKPFTKADSAELWEIDNVKE